MRHSTLGMKERSSESVVISSSEKLLCEWEARHDVAARGRRVDPAAALHRYLTQVRLQEERRHQDQPPHRPRGSAGRRPGHADRFAADHPLAASWLRWGEE
jgi:hypothetical protein